MVEVPGDIIGPAASILGCLGSRVRQRLSFATWRKFHSKRLWIQSYGGIILANELLVDWMKEIISWFSGFWELAIGKFDRNVWEIDSNFSPVDREHATFPTQ